MSANSDNLDLVQRYLHAIETGATGDALAAFFTPDAVQVEYPNRLVPAGGRHDLATMLQAAERGQRAVAAQRYTVQRSYAVGETVAIEVLWTGTLAVPFGSIPAGGEMRAHFAMFLDLRDGKIAAIRNYDCFEPF